MPSPTRGEQPPVQPADRTARSRKPVAGRLRAPERRPSQPTRGRGPAMRSFTIPEVRELPAPAVEETTDDTW
jgi:hypothetical protein